MGAEIIFCTDCAFLINNDDLSHLAGDEERAHRARFAAEWGSTSTAVCSTESFTDLSDDPCHGCMTDDYGPRYRGEAI